VGTPSKRILVVAGSPWFATRLAALAAPGGYDVARVDNAVAARNDVGHSSVAAVVAHLPPRSDNRGEDFVALLRSSGYGGLVVVLDRMRKTEGATHYLPRDASPSRIAAYIQKLIDPAA
jgi:hypothetical protein